MIAQDRQTEQLKDPKQMFRAFSYERRDLAPFIETEDFRPESARRFWDAYTPPNFELKRGPNDVPAYFNASSEAFCLAAAKRYNDYWSNRISNTDPQHARWSAYASIIWADSNQHGRMGSSAVCRVSGKVDAVRIPKQAYFVYRVMQNEQPDVHIIGHWNYPLGTKKTVYVAAANVTSIELYVNGMVKARSNTPQDGFIYEFPDIEFQPGTINALGYAGGKGIATHELKTVGEAKRLKLTVHEGPRGLQADGSDVAFVDFEVVDADGNRCPTDESRVDFELAGPATWRGGVNEGVPKSINNMYLSTECGINRVFIRSTSQPGKITLIAKRTGLEPATVNIESRKLRITDGLATKTP
jgi:beta-galactosidase